MQQKFNLGIYNTHIHAYVQTSGRQSLALLTNQQSINQSINQSQSILQGTGFCLF